MQNHLLNIALAGLTTGICLSAQLPYRCEIAMTKCSKSASPADPGVSSGAEQDDSEDQNGNGQDYGSPDESSCASSCSSCGGMGESSFNEASDGREFEAQPIDLRKIRLAKAAGFVEELRGMDK